MFPYTFYCISDPFLLLNKKNQPQHQRREKKKWQKKKIPSRSFSLRRYAVTPFTRYAVTRFTGNRLHAQSAAQCANFQRRSDRRWRLIRSHLLAISASKKAE